MCQFLNNQRRGLTLIELVIASTIMAIMAGVLGGLAMSVQMQSRHSQTAGEAVQHARVVLDRIQRTMNGAHSSSQFPGIFSVAETRTIYTLPDTVVVWNPTGLPAAPTGLPRWNEVVVYCANPNAQNVLWELTDPTNTNSVPAMTDLAAWKTELTSLKASSSAQKVELTNLLRTANVASSGAAVTRAALRFSVLMRPDDTQWQEYVAHTRNWEDLDWMQGIYGNKSGLRQVWCRIELQLVAGSQAAANDPSGQTALTFFGSASITQTLQHE